MGVEGTCRSGNRGGPLVLCSLYSGVSYFIPLHPSSLSPAYHQGQKASETGQKRAKVNKFLGVLGVLSGICETERGEKQRYIWNVGAKWVRVVALLVCILACPLVQASGFRTCQRLALVLWSCVPSFCPFLCLALVALLANMALFRILRGFLARFGGFVWVCVVLVVCVACVAFVRVWS